MKVLRAAGYKTMPWKNGMGATTEIAIFPPDATMANFDTRVSMAQVTNDGPFSSFPGIDRTLVVLDGAGLDLTVAHQAPVRIDSDVIHAFPGDQPTSATLIDGPIVDLNVMSRRDAASHHVRRVDLQDSLTLSVTCTTLLIVGFGEVLIHAPRNAILGPRDGALFDAKEITTLSRNSSAETGVFIVEIRIF